MTKFGLNTRLHSRNDRIYVHRKCLLVRSNSPLHRGKRVLCFAVAFALQLGCTDPRGNSLESDMDQAAKQPVFHLVTHAMPSDPFWAFVKRGWTDACQRYQIDGRYVGVRTDGNVGEMLGNLESIVATGSDGIACVITDQRALEPPLRRAIDQQVPVIAINVEDYRQEPKRIPYLTYIGEGSFETGQASAEILLGKFQERAGRVPRHAIYLIHATSIQCLEERGLGMEAVYQKAGSKFTKVACRFDPVTTQETLRAYIAANPDVEIVHSGCSQVAHWAVDLIKKMDRLAGGEDPFEEGKVHVGGIDMDSQLLHDILRGDAVATIDQQPYLQGYLAAVVLYQYRVFRLLPANEILTGPYVVDGSNAQQRLDQIERMMSGSSTN